MKHSKLVAVTGIAVLAVGLLAGCSSGKSTATPASSIKLSGVAFDSTDPYWITLMCGATQEAKKEGATIKWRAEATSSQSDEQAALQAAQLDKPSAILLGAVQNTAFSTTVKTIMTSGTPVVVVNTQISPANGYQAIVSDTDNSDFVKYVVKQLSGSDGSMAFLGGLPAAPPLIARYSQVITELKTAAPNLTILPTLYDNLDRNQAEAAAAAEIVAHPDLKALYAATGPEGEGAAAAVSQAGKQGAIKVYSYDATPAEVADLKAGTITALLAQPAGGQGALAVKVAIQAVKAHTKGAVKPAAQAQQTLPLKVLTKANMNDASLSGYKYSATCAG